jgi:hypothetical protein
MRCEERHVGEGKSDVETRCAQEIVERQGGSLDIESKLLRRMQKIVKNPKAKS